MAAGGDLDRVHLRQEQLCNDLKQLIQTSQDFRDEVSVLIETKQAEILYQLEHLTNASNSINDELDNVTETLAEQECTNTSNGQDMPSYEYNDVEGGHDPIDTQGVFTVLSPDDLHTDEYERFISRQMTYTDIYIDDIMIQDPSPPPSPTPTAEPLLDWAEEAEREPWSGETTLPPIQEEDIPEPDKPPKPGEEGDGGRRTETGGTPPFHGETPQEEEHLGMCIPT